MQSKRNIGREAPQSYACFPRNGGKERDVDAQSGFHDTDHYLEGLLCFVFSLELRDDLASNAGDMEMMRRAWHDSHPFFVEAGHAIF
jgi:hypothetical protein